MSQLPEIAFVDRPLYWFVLLDRAVQQGDHSAAADAQRQLARLGVRVAYGQAAGQSRTRSALATAVKNATGGKGGGIEYLA